MVDPTQALLVFAALTAVTCIVFWPRVGLAERIRRSLARSERVLLEDSLKHVYMCEREGRSSSLESMAGRLGITTGHAARLVSRLADAGALQLDGAAPELTDEGRQDALRLLRSHRLWERYLADRTGVPPGEWHREAERMEHALTQEETDALASRLGHPPFDPHGDPIPSSRGELPPPRVQNLAGADAGRRVEAVHVEDEPPEIYDALVADGLAPGLRMAVVERSGQSISVQAAGREWRIDTLLARNVTIRYLPEGEPVEVSVRDLRDAQFGVPVTVAGISSSCQGTQRRRLLDLGIVPGTVVTPELVSAAGDPVAYRIRGALIGLRSEQAAGILVEDDAVPAEALT